MSEEKRALPPLVERIDVGRPVMSREQLLSLGQRILQMTTLDVVDITVSHTARVITRVAQGRILSSDDGEKLHIWIQTIAGSPPPFSVYTNQLDDSVLLTSVQQCETLLRARPTYQSDGNGMKHETPSQDTPVSVRLWHDATVRAMGTSRATVIPEVLGVVAREQLFASGFLGIMARAQAVVRKDGNIAYFHDETDSEVSVTARTADGKASGWSGQTSRDWSSIRPTEVARRAADVAKRSVNASALEPGRRTAILTPSAVAAMTRYFAQQFSALSTDMGQTALSKSSRGGNKLRRRILDPRITLSSHPNDADGGYRPYIDQPGVATPPMTWVKDGTLVNMAYDPFYAMEHGKAYAALPFSFRMTGGTTTIEQMIAQCEEGIFVNRVSDVEVINDSSCMLTGVTRDGCFLIKDGKIDRPIRNFRFLTSPFFFLNNIEAIGPVERAAFGYMPKADSEAAWDYINFEDLWPRWPIIVPPIMVRDFNFSMLADAV